MLLYLSSRPPIICESVKARDKVEGEELGLFEDSLGGLLLFVGREAVLPQDPLDDRPLMGPDVRKQPVEPLLLVAWFLRGWCFRRRGRSRHYLRHRSRLRHFSRLA